MISNKGLNNFDSNLQSYTQGLSYLWSNPNKSINRKNIPNPFALFPAFPKTPWFSFPICPYYLIMLILLYMAIIMILARVCAVISTCLICCIKKSVRLLKESRYLSEKFSVLCWNMQGVIVNIVRILNYINHNEKILSYFLGVKKILVIVSTKILLILKVFLNRGYPINSLFRFMHLPLIKTFTYELSYFNTHRHRRHVTVRHKYGK